MIGIVDYGMGNLYSVQNAIQYLGVPVRICQNPKDLCDCERLVLPGVGAFRDCMISLKQRGFVTALNEAILQQHKPIMGICLGMQAMAKRSFENGEYTGLGWFNADVIRLQPVSSSLRVPQIGWNDVRYRTGSPLFAGLPLAPDFYFVHSYYMKCADASDVMATCEYGDIDVTAAIYRNNIFAIQFHPEKSQDYGLTVLQNFIEWSP